MTYETPEAACHAYEEEWPDRTYFDEEDRPMNCDDCGRLLFYDFGLDRYGHHTPGNDPRCWFLDVTETESEDDE